MPLPGFPGYNLQPFGPLDFHLQTQGKNQACNPQQIPYFNRNDKINPVKRGDTLPVSHVSAKNALAFIFRQVQISAHPNNSKRNPIKRKGTAPCPYIWQTATMLIMFCCLVFAI